ncbi:hypothetical protein [Mucilaginibacter sp. L196]|uniref:hypothetical protein n=1 Tax=Mucilaginibacter sp. L196 TaxID=1641870 RepID=UPI00131A69DC|nr:hypothetical protein [Mucilaginibacter sp. L196]
MSKQTSDILWSLVMLIVGIAAILTNYKKDPSYKDRFGYRINGLVLGIFATICGIYLVCKVLFFNHY